MHIAAIEQSSHLRLLSKTGHSVNDTSDPSTTAAQGPDLQSTLNIPGTDVVVICSAPEDRSYWIRSALDAGHRVVSRLPQSLPASIDMSRLRPDIPLAWTGIDTQLTQRAGQSPDLSYVRATIRIPCDWVQTEGVLHGWGMWCPALLQQVFGPIDTVRAHSRSHRRRGLFEDHVLAHLTFTNGIEGHFEIDALGNEARWEVELRGGDAPNQCGGDMRRERSEGLAALYASLGPTAATGGMMGESTLREALFLSHWMRQCARLEKSLTRREARRI